MESLRSDDRRRWFVPLVVVFVAVYSWVAAGLRPFTLGEEIMVAIPAILVLVAAARPSPPALEGTAARSSRGSAALWLGLVAIAFVWELFAYFSSPRHDHPTLSVIADEIMSVHFGRAVLFLLWLALGWLFVMRPRAERP
jgi:hypothetical protein